MISDNLQKEIANYCNSKPNEESGGIIARDSFNVLKNTSKDKKNYYETHFDDLSIDYIVHSHLNSGEPSKIDQIVCNKLQIPLVIFSILNQDFTYVYPTKDYKIGYYDRPYIYSILDCLELVRDFYLYELNIEIKPFLDPLRHLHSNKKLIFSELNTESNMTFVNYFIEQGFQSVSKKEIKKHDIILYNGDIIKPAHACGIYMGNNQILEHKFEKPSGINFINLNDKHIISILRHKSMCN